MTSITIQDRYTYNTNDLIGKGTFSKVFRGTDNINKIKVALKRLKKKQFDEEENMLRLQKEINILKLMKDEKYSIYYYDTIFQEKYIYIILELCDCDLQKEIDKQGKPFSLNTICKILYQLNQVFYKIKTNGIIHRDLKLQNIFVKYTNPPLNTEFDIKLGDFGVSTITQSNIASTFAGTPLTMAPEIMTCNNYSNKVDIWSLGIIIYYCYFKKFPFNSQVLRMLSNGDINVSSLPKEPQLADLLKKMLKPQPSERISWDEYFEHPFFKELKYTPPELKQPNEVSSIILPETKEKITQNKLNIQFGNQNHSLRNENYFCCLNAKNKTTNKKIIIKQYSNKFISSCKIAFVQEKELFGLINRIGIPSIQFKEEEKNETSTTLIFENIENVEVLGDYIQHNHLSEKSIYSLITSLVKDIFIPLCKNSIKLDIVSLDSILITNNTQNNQKSYLFDCGLHSQLYSSEEKKNYFLYEDQSNLSGSNEKTNVLNFGVTMFKVFFKEFPHLLSNKIIYPRGFESSDEFHNFLETCLYKDPEKRGNWNTLLKSKYISSPFTLKTKNKSLFTSNSIDYINRSAYLKNEVIHDFLKSELYKQLRNQKNKEINIPQFISLFLFSIVADMYYANLLFQNIAEPKEALKHSITIFQINKKLPISSNPYTESLDFSLIQEDKRFFVNEVKEKIQDMPEMFDLLRKESTQLFKQESKKANQKYPDMKLEQLLNEILKNIINKKFNNFINILFRHIMSCQKKNKNLVLFLKYNYEFLITFYCLILGKQNIVQSAFYEINDLLSFETKSNRLLITTKQINDNVEENMTFISFLQNGFKKCNIKEIIKMNNENIKNLENDIGEAVKKYIDCVDKLNDL